MDARYADQRTATAARGALGMRQFEPGDKVLVATYALVCARRGDEATGHGDETPWVPACVEAVDGARVSVRTVTRAFKPLQVPAQFVTHNPAVSLAGTPDAAAVLDGRMCCGSLPVPLQATVEALALTGRLAGEKATARCAPLPTGHPMLTEADRKLVSDHVGPICSSGNYGAGVRSLLADRLARRVLDQWRRASPAGDDVEASRSDLVAEAARNIHRCAYVWDPTGERAAAAQTLVLACHGLSPWNVPTDDTPAAS